MICYLTSSTIIRETGALNPANGQIQRLRENFPTPCRAVFVCSDPDGHERTDAFAASVEQSFLNEGLSFDSFAVLDGRNAQDAAALVHSANFLVFAGGHVPTQNAFFRKIALRELLRGFDGVIVAISAGTMNSAGTVYAQPELPGEATDPDYARFLPGLGLTDIMVIPHYQMIKDDVLDGLRVMEDIAYPDSRGRRFVLLEDGSYLYLKGGKTLLCGKAYLLADGALTPLTADGETMEL